MERDLPEEDSRESETGQFIVLASQAESQADTVEHLPALQQVRFCNSNDEKYTFIEYLSLVLLSSILCLESVYSHCQIRAHSAASVI